MAWLANQFSGQIAGLATAVVFWYIAAQHIEMQNVLTLLIGFGLQIAVLLSFRSGDVEDNVSSLNG